MWCDGNGNKKSKGKIYLVICYYDPELAHKLTQIENSRCCLAIWKPFSVTSI